MPASPEIGQGPAAIGITEIFRQMEAKHPAEADRHIGISGEIEIKLQRIGDRSHPQTGDRGGVQVPVCAGYGSECSELVRKNDFFAKPRKETFESFHDLGRAGECSGKIPAEFLQPD